MTESQQNNLINLSLRAGSSQAEIAFKALNNAVRVQILEFLTNHAATISQISIALDIPQSTVKQHVNLLEEAELINTYLRSATRGTEKVCSGLYKNLTFDLNPPAKQHQPYAEISMPIGCFSDFAIVAPCGLVSYSGVIGMQGEASSFYEPDRVEAQLLWFTEGFVEYRFAKKFPPKACLSNLSISMEACSEAPGYDNDWLSDITVWINDVEIGTWTSPSDFGGKRGVLTPAWWVTDSTQFGLLKTWKVTDEGSFIDDEKAENVNLNTINIQDHPYVSVKIGIKHDAKNRGGINILGRQFGNFSQDIVLRIVYDNC
jgi:predicted transcriptional regulator